MDSFASFDVASFTSTLTSPPGYDAASPASSSPGQSSPSRTRHANPFLAAFLAARASLLSQHPCLPSLFSPSTPPAARAACWEALAAAGERLVDEYAWCVPSDLAIDVLLHHSPVVEVGSGANACWARAATAAGADHVAYDANPAGGGRIGAGSGGGEAFRVMRGGPEVLSRKANRGRTLFLAFPDEFSELGLACLSNYAGDVVIHAGELFGDGVGHEQAPWGRSSSPEFLATLQKDFHCVLKAALPR